MLDTMISTIALALVVTGMFVPAFNAPFVKSADGPFLMMKVDRTVITIGTSINIMLTLGNIGDNNGTATFAAPLFDVYYDTLEGRFNWSDGKYFVLPVLPPKLDPGEDRNGTVQWNLYQYKKGEYVPPKPGVYHLWGKCLQLGIDTSSSIAVTLFSRLLGDLDGNGVVNIQDITIVAVAYGSSIGNLKWNPLADLDQNGVINIMDISIVAKDYEKTT